MTFGITIKISEGKSLIKQAIYDAAAFSTGGEHKRALIFLCNYLSLYVDMSQEEYERYVRDVINHLDYPSII